MGIDLAIFLQKLKAAFFAFDAEAESSSYSPLGDLQADPVKSARAIWLILALPVKLSFLLTAVRLIGE